MWRVFWTFIMETKVKLKVVWDEESQDFVIRLRFVKPRFGRRKQRAALKNAIENSPRLDEQQDNAQSNSTQLIPINHIGTFHSVFQKRNGTPRQGCLAPHAEGFVQLHGDSILGGEGTEGTVGAALEGLEAYSHVWLMFIFHENRKARKTKMKIRPPRLMGEKVGVFASRAPHRPNPIGLSLVGVKSIDVKQGRLYCRGVDLIEGTPIIDIKPYIPQYDNPTLFHHAETVRMAEWVNQPQSGILNVTYDDKVETTLQEFDYAHSTYDCKATLKVAIEEMLKSDPRSIHRKQKHDDTNWWIHFDSFRLTLTMPFSDTIHVQSIDHTSK